MTVISTDPSDNTLVIVTVSSSLLLLPLSPYPVAGAPDCRFSTIWEKVSCTLEVLVVLLVVLHSALVLLIELIPLMPIPPLLKIYRNPLHILYIGYIPEKLSKNIKFF
jgi:hypothetical protein